MYTLLNVTVYQFAWSSQISFVGHELQGGLQSTIHGTNNTVLTAFVAIAMIEYGFEPTDPSLVSAFQCIDQQIYNDTYDQHIYNDVLQHQWLAAYA